MKDLPIIFSAHAEESMRKRGASREEVKKVIRNTTSWTEAREGRQEAKLDMPFDAKWNKILYKTKQVNPVFVTEKDSIVVITVYVFYF